MTFVDALAVLVRRWYIVVLGLAITAVLATLAAYRFEGGTLVHRFAPEYEASAMMSVTPNDPAAPTAGSAPKLAYSLKAIAESASFGRRIGGEVAGWAGGSIKASVPTQTSVLELLVAGPTPAAADAAIHPVLADLPAAAGPLVTSPTVAPTMNPFTIDVVGAPTPPAEQPSTKGPLALTLVLLLGLAATWSAALSFDRVRARRVTRQAAAPHDVDVRDPEPDAPRSRRVPELAGDGARG